MQVNVKAHRLSRARLGTNLRERFRVRRRMMGQALPHETCLAAFERHEGRWVKITDFFVGNDYEEVGPASFTVELDDKLYACPRVIVEEYLAEEEDL